MSPSAPVDPSLQIARDVLEGLLEGCQVISPDYRYLYVNAAVVAQGRRPREALVGRTMAECYPGIEQTPMFAELRRCMAERAHHRMENEFTFPDGSAGWFELRFVPVPEGVCILSLDVSEGKRAAAAVARLEEQFRQAQKMEAVGRLAGGVAHDFNNSLSVVLSYCELLLGDLRTDDPMRPDLDEIRKAGVRAAELTRQLLAFSSRQPLDPRVVDLDQIVVGVERMLARLVGADVEVTVLRGAPTGRVRVDPGQIEQVLMNLAVNARDAMPRGGKLTLQISDAELDAHYASEHHGVTPGPYVMLAVSDTGTGMDRPTLSRIFEPFFTTKDKGKGTGLGLAMVFGVVNQSGGHVWVYSEPGKGTTFKLYFPRADGAETAAPSPQLEPDSGRGTETILLVEDDDQVRAVARGILRRRGYTVLDAPGAGHALLVHEQHAARIHLLLVDVVMPLMTGPELAERLVAARPGLKVLFMSGYTAGAISQHGLLDSTVAFLQKPLTPQALARKVRQVLGAGEG